MEPRPRRVVKKYSRPIVVPEYPKPKPPEEKAQRKVRRLGKWGRMRRYINPTLGGPGIKDLYFFSVSFRTCVLTGIPIAKVFAIMSETVRNLRLHKACERIAADLENGESISDLLQKHDNIFPAFFREVFLGGLESGSLSYTTKLLVDHYNWIIKLRSVILSIIWYPVFLMFAGAGIMAVRDIVIVYLTSTLSALQALSIIFDYYKFPVCGVLLAMLTARFLKMKQLKVAVDRMFGEMPVFGRLYNRYSLAVFFGVLAGSVEAGSDVTRGLRSAVMAMNNLYLGRKLLEAERYLAHGESFTYSFAMTKVMDGEALGMIRAGEEGAAMDILLRKLADYYFERVRTYLPALLKVFFPLAMICVAIAFFVFPPIMGIGVYLLCLLLFLTI